jgi:hypothetical protein
MSGLKPLAVPADVIYTYDGCFDGFLCCVFESVYSGELPFAILREADAQPTLMRTHSIETDPA